MILSRMPHFGGVQGGAIQDVSIRLAPDAFAGFGGGGGAGTSHINVAVTGGVHGVWFLETEGAALLGAATLTNQSGSAIVYSGQQTLIVVGAHIIRSTHATGAAIDVPASRESSRHPSDAPITVLDSVVECTHLPQLISRSEPQF